MGNTTLYEKLASPKPKYFFAIDLYECVHVLPRLLGSVLEAMQFLGPENCALSIVEGRSKDGTNEVLQLLGPELDRLGVAYFLATNDVDPMHGTANRMDALAQLRNQALQPLVDHAAQFAPDTTVVFLNDVALCADDVLELLHQRVVQRADMVCAMDWNHAFGADQDPVFYDVYIGRQLNGDTFFDVPRDGSWGRARDLFWNDADALARYTTGRPTQVFACWNGATAFRAGPLVAGTVRFRRNLDDECFGGEPTLFCKDMWYHGFGRIAVVPSVTGGYSDAAARHVKERRGYVADWVRAEMAHDTGYQIQWKGPPDRVKCAPTWDRQSWVPWDEALAENGVYP